LEEATWSLAACSIPNMWGFVEAVFLPVGKMNG